MDRGAEIVQNGLPARKGLEFESSRNTLLCLSIFCTGVVFIDSSNLCLQFATAQEIHSTTRLYLDPVAIRLEAPQYGPGSRVRSRIRTSSDMAGFRAACGRPSGDARRQYFAPGPCWRLQVLEDT